MNQSEGFSTSLALRWLTLNANYVQGRRSVRSHKHRNPADSTHARIAARRNHCLQWQELRWRDYT